uniref:Uncharacterized protein n=1 Tax=Columba livia TaxID=8932 RepID=R7VRM7_COLLI
MDHLFGEFRPSAQLCHLLASSAPRSVPWGGRVRNRKGFHALQTPFRANLKHSPVRPAEKNVDSIPARPSTTDNKKCQRLFQMDVCCCHRGVMQIHSVVKKIPPYLELETCRDWGELTSSFEKGLQEYYKNAVNNAVSKNSFILRKTYLGKGHVWWKISLQKSF